MNYKRNNLITIALAILMSVIICLVTLGSVPITIYTAYISPELEKIIEKSSKNSLIPVDIWLYETNSSEIETQLKKITGINSKTIKNEATLSTLTNAQIDSYITSKRELYSETRVQESETFLSKYTNIFNSKTNEGEKIIFVSKYAPVVKVEITPSQIATLSKDLEVSGIYYSPNIEIANASIEANNTTSANYLRDSLAYDGTGIKIGMIEAEVPDRTKSYFTTANIIYDPNITPGTAEQPHANLVASIMVAKSTTINGKTYKGIAPNATLYASKCSNFDEKREGVEWLISQGVNIINCSNTYINATGYYIGYDRWFEHLAITHSVHFVVCAGNIDNDDNPTGYITSPGLSFNVITVGNLNDNNSTSHYDDYISDSSAYIEQDNNKIPNKPDLVAPGDNITTAAGNDSGTSFAAPQVSAIIAQLCQARPALKTMQSIMKSILTAAIGHSTHSYTPSDTEYDKYGAGCISAQAALYTINNNRYISSSFSATATADTSATYTFTASPVDTKIRISLSWLKNLVVTGDHTTNNGDTSIEIADLDLYIYNSSGTPIYHSNISQGNVEIVEMNSVTPGETYTIEVNMYSSPSTTVYYAIAWW